MSKLQKLKGQLQFHEQMDNKGMTAILKERIKKEEFNSSGEKKYLAAGKPHLKSFSSLTIEELEALRNSQKSK